MAAASAAPARGPAWLNPHLPVRVRVDDLMSRMSLHDKLCQMTQAERSAITDPTDIATYRLGSLLSGGGSTPTPNTPTAWADMYESFGETPKLASSMTTLITGPQGDSLGDSGSAPATGKHYAGDGGTGGVNEGNTELTEAQLRAIHLPPSRAAVDRGVGSVMISFSSWNGVKTHTNHYLITARQAVRESRVLLKNDGALPLSRHDKTFVTGKNADDIGNQSGGWTITWQGSSGPITPGTTIRQGIQQKAWTDNVTYGDYNPTGKPPDTWPRSASQEPINVEDGQQGLFPFGFGPRYQFDRK